MDPPTPCVPSDPAPSSSISSTLLAGLKVQDAEAYRRLVYLFGPVVYEWCRRCRLQASDAGDVAQEVFRSVTARVSGFERGTFRGWLWTITRNKIRDHFRVRRADAAAIGGTNARARFEQLADPAEDTVEEPPVSDTRRLLTRRVLEMIRGDFDERTWQAFWRMAVDGHASADIAADLRMSNDAVRQAKRRVLRRLQEELSALLGD
jgi:RNA polymerase sigma-70 factor (ECF subfamily)